MPIDFKALEEKWRREWEKAKIFESDPIPDRRKCFVTVPYPYMDGPLHVGHGFTSTRVDIYARFRRMQGYNTLFPWAWHWTGEPIVGAALRLKRRDEGMIRALKLIDGVSEEELEKLTDPAYMARYYTEDSKEVLKRLGLSIDWRREFHTTYLEPTYSRFIEWQYETLGSKGFVTKGTHPVVWCPHDESPTGDHDRLEGEGVSPEEYTLIKFRIANAYAPAATFRPETIYGITNMFVNPDAPYVEALVDGERWIVSQKAAMKLKEQLRKVEVLREFKGSELVGKTFEEPIGGRSLPILPGWFVDPEAATGLVYSVPSHAPVDWVAIRDLLEEPEKLRLFGVSPEVVRSIKPISLIKVEGYGEHPAIEIVERMGIKDQLDARLEEATNEIYRKEFHTGILKPICGKYAGRLVSEVKAELIEEFKNAGIADSMYDLPRRVVCRCTTPCIVKILEDQWFLRYSDQDWKTLAHEAVDMATIYPESARSYFHQTIDWLRDWPCARRTGLGTPLPWSKDWIVETLSDSTIYMAFYTIRKHIVASQINEKQLTNEVFDYIFLGKGNPEEISKRSALEASLLKEMRNEFLYWYPVDLRNSAKELIRNHLTFFIFHHVALFERRHWPRGIGLNGYLMVEGAKMSKSKGNFVTLKNAVNSYGADATRLTLALGAQGMDDPDWRSSTAQEVRSRLEAFFNFVTELSSLEVKASNGHLEAWILSRLQERIKQVTEELEVLRTRSAAEVAFYEVWNDLRWYLRRVKVPDAATLKEFLGVWIRLMAPFVPFICEELWHRLGNRSFVSNAPWPLYDANKVDEKALEIERFLKDLLEDTQRVLQATGLKPRLVSYYTAAAWKYKAYGEVLCLVRDGITDTGAIIRKLREDPYLAERSRLIPSFVSKALEDAKRLPKDRIIKLLELGFLNELEVLKGASGFLAEELRSTVVVYDEDDGEKYDPKNRASAARPGRPAIYVE
ncbi:MAG: leucine--tRNA ligase [Candidatus Bathyarchaeia archaeon]